MKTVHIEFTFDDEDWARYKEKYSDKEIRQILMEGGMGELDELMGHGSRTDEEHE